MVPIAHQLTEVLFDKALKSKIAEFILQYTKD